MDWYGVLFQSNSTGNLVQCDVRYATSGVSAEAASIHISGCVIRDFRLRGIYVVGTMSNLDTPFVTVDHSYVGQSTPSEQNKGEGIYIYRNAEVLVTNSRITGCLNGVRLLAYCSYRPQFTVRECNIQNNAALGILAATSG